MLIGLLSFPPCSVAADQFAWRLDNRCQLRLATVEEAQQALTQVDAFVEALSPFDRQARLKTDRAVSRDEWLAFVRGHVLGWTEAEAQRLGRLVARLSGRLAPWSLPWPAEILLVKTTGQEEGQAAYCRGAAIVLPQRRVDAADAALESLLTHELFHILSRANPPLRDALYRAIGFEACGPIGMPAELDARRITNPDAPRAEHFIELMVDGRPRKFAPLLLADPPRYDLARAGEFFAYLQFRLLEVERRDGAWQAVIAGGQPVLLPAMDLPAYQERIGRNTRYIIHPEEILADNFVLLVEGRKQVPSPAVLEAFERTLRTGP